MQFFIVVFLPEWDEQKGLLKRLCSLANGATIKFVRTRFCM
jgi:hypothetical protein